MLRAGEGTPDASAGITVIEALPSKLNQQIAMGNFFKSIAETAKLQYIKENNANESKNTLKEHEQVSMFILVAKNS